MKSMKITTTLLLTLGISIFSMASNDLIGDFTGTWAYEVTNTPEGDYKGDMIIEKEGSTYSGYLLTPTPEGDYKTVLKNVKVEDGTLSFGLTTDGFYVTVKLQEDGANLKGSVYAEGESFPITATPK